MYPQMPTVSVYGHKHGRKHTTLSIPLTALMMAVALPSNALAFEASLPTSPSASFTIPVQLSGRDPYLAQAIEALPTYSYTEAGSIVSTHSPITTHALRQPKLKLPAPVTVIAAATAPITTPAAAPVSVPVPVSNGESVLVLEGEASYYSRAGCLGCDPNVIMANGQPLNDNALTMAIGADKKHLVGHQARVTSLATGKSVQVRITDTGGFYKAKYGHRVADLTIATKTAIGMAGGVGQVRVEVF